MEKMLLSQQCCLAVCDQYEILRNLKDTPGCRLDLSDESMDIPNKHQNAWQESVLLKGQCLLRHTHMPYLEICSAVMNPCLCVAVSPVSTHAASGLPVSICICILNCVTPTFQQSHPTLPTDMKLAGNAVMQSLLPHSISHARGMMLLWHVTCRTFFCRSLCVFCSAACGRAAGLEEEGRPAELFGPSPQYAQGCLCYAGKHSCPCCSLSAYMPDPAFCLFNKKLSPVSWFAPT